MDSGTRQQRESGERGANHRRPSTAVRSSSPRIDQRFCGAGSHPSLPHPQLGIPPAPTPQTESISRFICSRFQRDSNRLPDGPVARFRGNASTGPESEVRIWISTYKRFGLPEAASSWLRGQRTSTC